MTGRAAAAPSMLHPSRDPRRRGLPLEQWPEGDRQTWQATLEPGDPLDPGGAGADWALATIRIIQRGYGQWLAWLQRTGCLDPDVTPTARVVPEMLARYIADLQPIVSSQTVLTYVEAIAHFCRAATPGADWAWLMRLVSRLKRRVVPARPKRHRVVPTQDLLSLGLGTMHDAAAASQVVPWRAACRYRDGLIVALLAVRPLRLRNFAAIEIGRHLTCEGGRYVVRFAPAETKSRRELAFVVPEALTAPLERYVSRYRPLLCARAGARVQGVPGTPAGMRLWVSAQGSAMIERSVYESVVTLTGAQFRRPVNPHLFRDCAGTSIATDDPEHVHVTASLLGHTSLATSERYYDHAQSLQAVRRHQILILQLRQKSEALVGFQGGEAGSYNQGCDERAEQGFAAPARVVHELKEAEIVR
jgi:integrase/recombinase XerD